MSYLLKREKVFLYERNKSLQYVVNRSRALVCTLRSQRPKSINSALYSHGRVDFYHVTNIETNTRVRGLKEDAVNDYRASVAYSE